MIRVRIADIIPCTEYEGKIYDQTICIELADRSKITIFDSAPTIAKKESIGKTKNVKILAFLTTIEKMPQKKTGVIWPDPKAFSGNFFGKVTKIHEKGTEGTLDIGVGTIVFEIMKKDRGKFKVSDFVKVYSTRTDLLEIE